MSDYGKDKVLREYLKPDPQGYYVLLISKEELNKIPSEVREKLVIEEISANEYIVKTQSRSLIKKLIQLIK